MENFDFDKVAKLSRLEFADNEKQSFINDMQEMLRLADTLCELDSEETPRNVHENILSLSSDDEHNLENFALIKQSKRNDGTFATVPSSID